MADVGSTRLAEAWRAMPREMRQLVTERLRTQAANMYDLASGYEHVAALHKLRMAEVNAMRAAADLLDEVARG